MLQRNMYDYPLIGVRSLESQSNSWMQLPFKALRLGLEAQTVIGLRLIKLSLGGCDAAAEAERMITEKAVTALDAQADFLSNTLAGRHHRASSRALALYRQRVRANRRRLTSSI